MINMKTAFSAIICASLVYGCSGETPNTLREGLAIQNVNVISMVDESVLAGRTVLVQAGQIRVIAPTGELALADTVEVVDGSGKYLMPGLVDMHKHIMSPECLTLDVVYGVTAVRNMWGNDETLGYAAEIASGVRLGPEIVNGSPLIDGDPPYFPGSATLIDPADAEALVLEMKAKGFAFLKPYEVLKEDVYFALMAAAEKHGINVEGHIPQSVSAFDAFEAGHDTVEHSMRFDSAIVNPDLPWSTAFRPKELVDIVARIDAGELTYEQAFSREKLRELSRLIVEKGAAVVPTLGVLGVLQYSDDDREAMKNHPQIEYVNPGMRTFWLVKIDPVDSDVPERARPALTDAEIDSLEDFAVREYGEWVGVMHEEGVLLMAGVDAPNPGMFQGYSLHEELQHFVNRAGLSNYEALKTATVNPATWWGKAGTSGVVTEGADADLVLLAANPLEDISNTLKIEGVVLDGNWLARHKLDALQEEVAAAYREMEQNMPAQGEAQQTGLPLHFHHH